MNSENKIYKINYLEHEDKFSGGVLAGMYARGLDNSRKMRDRASKMTSAVKESARKMGESASKMGETAAVKLRFEPVRKIVEYNLGGRTFPGINCTTIPVLIEHLIRKYLISEQCSINSDFNYDFITGNRGEEYTFQDNKFRKIIYNKMMNWLSNKEEYIDFTQASLGEGNREGSLSQSEFPTEEEGGEEEGEEGDEGGFSGGATDDEATQNNYEKLDVHTRSTLDDRLVNGGGLYNLDIGFVNGNLYVPRNVNLFSSDRFFELIRNPTNDTSEDQRRKYPTIRMSHYSKLLPEERFTRIDNVIIIPKITLMSNLLTSNELIYRKDIHQGLAQTIADPRAAAATAQTKKINKEVEARNDRPEYKLSSKPWAKSYKKQCDAFSGTYDSKLKKCYKNDALPLVYEQAQLQQIPIQQIPIQQMPIQQIPIQQMPLQQVQMIPVQMGGISDESDYLVKKELGTKGFKKLKNGIKKLFDEFNESEQVNLLKEKDSNLLEYMVWNYGLKQNI